LRKGRQRIHVPARRRDRFQFDQRAHQSGQRIEVAGIVGIGEPVPEQQSGRLSLDLGNRRIAIGKTALLALRTPHADIEGAFAGTGACVQR
jgi:hypothetical protein